MAQEHGDFKVLGSFGVLFCGYCKWCVEPAHMMGHLKAHKGMSKMEKEEMVRWVGGVHGLSWKLEDVRYPSKESDGVKELEVERGYGCRWMKEDGVECDFVCGNEKWMKEHLKKTHGWKNERNAGRYGRGKGLKKDEGVEGSNKRLVWYEEKRGSDGLMKREVLYEGGVKYQMFFVRGSWRKAFEVKREKMKVLNPKEDELERLEMAELEEKMMEKMETRVEELNKELRDGRFDDHLEREDVNNWLKFSKWNEYVRGVEMREVRRWFKGWSEEEEKRWEIMRMRGDEEEDEEETWDEEDEKSLRKCCELNEEVMFDVMVLVGSERCGENVLRYVCRKESGEKESTKKLRGNWMVETLRKYSDCWRKVLCFVWRTRDKKKGLMSCEMSEEERVVFELMKEGVEGLRKRGGFERREEVKKMIVDLWLTMLGTSLDGDGRMSVFVCGIVLLGVDCWSGSWRDGGECGKMLNSFVGLSRGMVIWKSWEERMEEVVLWRKRGEPKERIEWEVKGLMERVVEKTDRLLMRLESGGRDDRSVRSMGMILNWRSYGMKMGMNKRVGMKMIWRGEEILIGNVRLTIESIKSWIWGLMRDCWKMLCEDLLFVDHEDQEELEGVGLMFDLKELVDELGEEKEGYSFVSDMRNVNQVFQGRGGLMWMRERIKKDEKLKRRFWEVRGGELTWRRKGINEYVRKVKVWKEMVLLLCHLSGGGPGRGREVLSVRRKNGRMGVMRGVYVDDGLVCLVSRYHKGYSIGMREKMVVRFLSEDVSRMMVLYLWIVCGFVDLILVNEFGRKRMGEFVWHPMKETRLLGAQEWKGVDVEGEVQESDEEEEEEEEEEDQDVEWVEKREDDSWEGLASVGEEIEKNEEKMRVLKEKMEMWRWRSDIKAKEDEEKLKMTRGWKGKEECLEVDGFWSGRRLSRLMMRDGRRRGLGGIGLKSWRDVYVGVQRRLCGERVRNHMEVLYGEGDGEKPQMVGSLMDNITSMQLGHGRRVENLMYGLSGGDSRLMSGDERLLFREVSMEWHRVMGIERERIWGFGDEELKRRDEKMVRSRLLRLEKIKRVSDEEWNTIFRKVLKKDDVCLRERQLEVLKEVVSGRWSDLLVVMKTGGGKSFMWMLPVYVGVGGVTIVVIPLVSLMEDVKRRLELMGLSCWIWSGFEEVVFDVSVVLVTCEGVNTSKFSRYLNELERRGVLDRMVVDECHELLSVWMEWRRSQLVVRRLRERGVCIVYTTATLPEMKMEEWCEVVQVRKSKLGVMRDESVRKNLRYGVVDYWKGQGDEELKRLVGWKRQEYGLGKKVMVFCETKVRVREVMELLRCKGYWSDVGSAREKRLILEEFFEGEVDVIVGTNALGLGIDSEKVRVVIHERMRRSMMSFGQESGRGGRDVSSRSESVVMRGVWVVGGRLVKEMVRSENEKENELLMGFLSGRECRRKSMDEWFDGVVRVGGCKVREGEEECDVCRGKVEEIVLDEVEEIEEVDEVSENDEVVREMVVVGGRSGKHEREESGVGLKELEVLRKEELKNEWKLRVEEKMDKERRRMEKVWKVEKGGSGGRERRRLERFGEMMNGWMYGLGRCWVCVGGGRRGDIHDWKDCDMRDRGERVVDVLERGIKKMKEVGGVGGRGDLMGGDRRNSGCWECGVMRELCGKWKRGDNGLMIKDRGIGGCSYEMDDVLGMLVYLLEVGVEEGELIGLRGFVRRRMSKEEGLGGGIECEMGVRVEGMRWMSEKVMRWLWRKRVWCIEGSGWGKGEIGLDEEDEDDERLVDDWRMKIEKDKGWKGWRGGIETNNVCGMLWVYGRREGSGWSRWMKKIED